MENKVESTHESTKNESRHKSRSQGFCERWKHVSVNNKLMVISSCLMTVATVVLVIAAYLQYRTYQAQLQTMNGQLSTMNDALMESRKGADAAVDAAKAAKDSASAANDAIKQNKDLVKAAQDQAGAAQTSASATVAGAQVAAKGLYVGNRPYIGVGDVTGVNMTDGQVPEFTARFKNTGNTPARDLHVLVQVDPRTDPLPKNPVYDNSTKQSQTVMTTGSVFAVKIINPLPIKQGGTAILKARKVFLYLYGMATYKDDLSDRCHVLRFCTLYNPDSKDFEWCGYYNREEDQAKCRKPN